MELGNRNYINEAIDTWSKLAGIDSAAKKQEREDQAWTRQQQAWGREDQLRGLMGVDPEDGQAVAKATGASAGMVVPVMGQAPDVAGTVASAGKAAIAGLVNNAYLPLNPTQGLAPFAGTEKANFTPDPRMQPGMTVPAKSVANTDTAVPKMQRIEAVLAEKNKADYADYQQGLDDPANMSTNAARLVMRQVVNDPSYSENDPWGQLQAITRLQGALKNMPATNQPFKLDDPALLATYDQAFPHVGGNSNLDNAKTRALFITPDPSGDPLKARIAVGISGQDKDGKEVQGVMTANRSSDPGDVVYNATTGEWLNKAQIVQRNIEGLLQARAKLGDEKAFQTYAELRRGKEVAALLDQQVAMIKNPDDRNIVVMNSYLVKNGIIKPEDGFNSSIKIFGEQSSLGRDLAKKEAEFNLQRKLDLATPEGQAKDATAQQTLDTRVGEEAQFNGTSTADLTPGQLLGYNKAAIAQQQAAAKLKKDTKTVKVDVGNGLEQTFQYNDTSGQYDIPIGKPGPKWAPTSRVAGDGATAEIKNLEYYKSKLGFTPVELKQQVQQGKVKLSDMVSKIYTDLKKNDSRDTPEDELIASATNAAGALYKWANAQGDPGQKAPVPRDVAPVTDYFNSVGKLESNKSAIDNIAAKGWTPEEIKRAAKGTDLEKAVGKYTFPRNQGMAPARPVTAPVAVPVVAPQGVAPPQVAAPPAQAQPATVANPFVPAAAAPVVAPVVAPRAGMAPAAATKPAVAAVVKGQPYSVVQNGRIVVKFQ